MTLNRREAKTGSGDWSPGGVWGGNPIVTPSAKRNPSMNQGAKRPLIPLTPHPLAPTSPIFQTPPAKRIIR